MTYTELLPLLLQKNLVQLRDPSPPANPPFWYKAVARCAFHKNAPSHTVENCYPLMSEVQKLVRGNMLTFKNVNPNVQSLGLLDEEIKGRKGHNYIEEEMTYGPLDSMLQEVPQRILMHNRDLYISAKYEDNILTDVLVDAGSSLNIMPWSTLEILSYQGATFRPNGASVLTFEGFSRTAIGEIDLPIRIRPRDFDITFQVMEIYPAYNYLLGRPWIHNAKVVPSTFHQMLKYPLKEKLITVYGEQTMYVCPLSSVPNIEEITAQFQALGVVIPEYEKKAGTSISSWKDAQQVVAQGSYEGWGRVV
ncbi:uncharacterized protein LOC131641420 [Vicia villosa]|uniref:uncharacterized protein LOC131641420 n=1 Tax=Vicia villosa TaxID=3911 RepID=UPI00273A85F2|nr:uncharacterized protein LOC131641420 [Vicia villosa]